GKRRCKTRGGEGRRNRDFIKGNSSAPVWGRWHRRPSAAALGKDADALHRLWAAQWQGDDEGSGSVERTPHRYRERTLSQRRRREGQNLYEIPITFLLLPSRKPMRPVAPPPGKIQKPPIRFAIQAAQEHSHAGHRHAGARARLLRGRHRLCLRLRTALEEQGAMIF